MTIQQFDELTFEQMPPLSGRSPGCSLDVGGQDEPIRACVRPRGIAIEDAIAILETHRILEADGIIVLDDGRIRFDSFLPSKTAIRMALGIPE